MSVRELRSEHKWLEVHGRKKWAYHYERQWSEVVRLIEDRHRGIYVLVSAALSAARIASMPGRIS